MMGEGQRIDFYGRVPSWLNRLPTKDDIVVSTLKLFGDNPIGLINSDYFEDHEDWAAGIWRWPIRVSSPERAILEFASLQIVVDFFRSFAAS